MAHRGRRIARSVLSPSSWRNPLTLIALVALVALVVLVASSVTAHATPPCGTWGFVASPTPASGGGNLGAVAVLGPADAWAVGYNADATETLVLHWDGSAWSISPSPNPSTFRTQNFFAGVAAIAQDDAWAVGSYNSSGGGDTGLPTVQTLAAHWDGAQWSVVPSPAILGGSNFSGVSALSSHDVWAVGLRSFSPTPAEKPLTAHWDGARWSEIPAPFVGNRINQLLGVSARTASDAWAVGTWRSTSTTFHVLILHWNGSEWSVSPAPDPGINDELLSVVAVSANDVWAAGDRHDAATDTQQPLLMHWNGSGWNMYPLPLLPGGFARLNAIRAASATDIWAVGAFAAVAGGAPEPLLMHWDGTSWSAVDVGPIGGNSAYISGLAVAPACEAWAVGSFVSGGVMVPLTERLGSAAPLPLDVPGNAPGAPGGGVFLSLAASPNPANGAVRLSIVLSRATAVRADVFDARGQIVRGLGEHASAAGSLTVAWDGRNEAGAVAPPGLYFVRVHASGESRVVRLVLRQ